MTELKDLLEKYADTCGTKARLEGAIEYESSEHGKVPASVFAALKSVEKRKANLEEQISNLFVGDEGARLEREECIKIAEEIYAEPGWCGDYKIAAFTIAKAIRGRGEKCACHLGSVCTSACEQGKHHEGCGGKK